MKETQLARSIDRWIRPIGGALGFLGLANLTRRLFDGPPYVVPMTDFGRDLMSARAIQLGTSPYQTIGELSGVVPDWPVTPEVLDYWVVHTPASLAAARVWLVGFGERAAEQAAISVQWVAFFALIAVLVVYSRQRWSIWHGAAIAGAIALTHGWKSDLAWVQGAAVVAVALTIVFYLEDSQARTLGLILLGLLVALRPWLAPIALVLPNSRSLGRDVAVVGGAAGFATLLSIAWIGGWGVVLDWMQRALPGNFDFYGPSDWNLSPVGRLLPVWVATAVFVVTSLVLASFRHRLSRSHWLQLGIIVVLVASPLVWAQYWLALIPLFVVACRRMPFALILTALLLQSWPLVERSGTIQFVCSLVAAGIVAVHLVQQHRHVDQRIESQLTSA